LSTPVPPSLQWHTGGDVYLNGEAFYEKETAAEVDAQTGSWHGRVAGERTILRANFGNLISIGADFNGKLFSPSLPGPLADLKPAKNRITWSLRRQ
jgi:hypothetical protein